MIKSAILKKYHESDIIFENILISFKNINNIIK
jgi:hypothetical protein